MKKCLKASFRQRLKHVERRIERLPEADPFRPVLIDYADAMRSTLLEGGVAPSELGGVRVFDDLPPTNGDLERYMRRIKTGHRQVTGRKNVHDFLIRYGRYAACVDYRESVGSVITNCQCVTMATDNTGGYCL